MLRTWVWSLFGELRSHMLRSNWADMPQLESPRSPRYSWSPRTLGPVCHDYWAHSHIKRTGVPQRKIPRDTLESLRIASKTQWSQINKCVFLKCINFSVNKPHAILKSSSLFMYSPHFSGCPVIYLATLTGMPSWIHKCLLKMVASESVLLLMFSCWTWTASDKKNMVCLPGSHC